MELSLEAIRYYRKMDPRLRLALAYSMTESLREVGFGWNDYIKPDFPFWHLPEDKVDSILNSKFETEALYYTSENFEPVLDFYETLPSDWKYVYTDLFPGRYSRSLAPGELIPDLDGLESVFYNMATYIRYKKFKGAVSWKKNKDDYQVILSFPWAKKVIEDSDRVVAILKAITFFWSGIYNYDMPSLNDYFNRVHSPRYEFKKIDDEVILYVDSSLYSCAIVYFTPYLKLHPGKIGGVDIDFSFEFMEGIFHISSLKEYITININL